MAPDGQKDGQKDRQTNMDKPISLGLRRGIIKKRGGSQLERSYWLALLYNLHESLFTSLELIFPFKTLPLLKREVKIEELLPPQFYPFTLMLFIRSIWQC